MLKNITVKPAHLLYTLFFNLQGFSEAWAEEKILAATLQKRSPHVTSAPTPQLKTFETWTAIAMVS